MLRDRRLPANKQVYGHLQVIWRIQRAFSMRNKFLLSTIAKWQSVSDTGSSTLCLETGFWRGQVAPLYAADYSSSIVECAQQPRWALSNIEWSVAVHLWRVRRSRYLNVCGNIICVWRFNVICLHALIPKTSKCITDVFALAPRCSQRSLAVEC